MLLELQVQEEVDLLEKFRYQVSGKTNIMKLEDEIQNELQRRKELKSRLQTLKKEHNNKVLKSLETSYPRLFSMLEEAPNTYITLKQGYMIVFYETEIEYKLKDFFSSGKLWWHVADEFGNPMSEEKVITKLVQEVAIYREENYIDDKDSDSYWGS